MFLPDIGTEIFDEMLWCVWLAGGFYKLEARLMGVLLSLRSIRMTGIYQSAFVGRPARYSPHGAEIKFCANIWCEQVVSISLMRN